MIIDIPQDLALRIEELAEEQGSTVEDLLRGLVDRQMVNKPQLTLQDLARNAREAGLKSDKPVDTAERSREILETEYTDYLKRHQTESPTSRDSAGQQIPRQN